LGQLPCLIEFLIRIDLWWRWQKGCPLAYTSQNAPTKAEVLGTRMLSALSGHKRDSRLTAIRCDGVNPGRLQLQTWTV